MKINCLHYESIPGDILIGTRRTYVGINCIHYECMDAYITIGFWRNREKPVQIQPIAKLEGSDRYLDKTINPIVEGIKVQERHAEKAHAKRKKSQETSIHITGGIVSAILEASQENIAEKSKEKIKLLRESIIKEYKDGIS